MTIVIIKLIIIMKMMLILWCYHDNNGSYSDDYENKND